jgi:hypothetical protein
MIIGLHGASRAGKDSVATILRDEHGFEWRSFAANLRTILCEINPFLPEMNMHLVPAVAQFGWDKVKEKSYSSVEMMISLGQSVRDTIDLDAWVRPVMRGLDDPLKNVVISDVRQPNEVEAIQALGGQIWKINRPGSKSRGMDHLLEDYDFDTIIYNNGTLKNLSDIVKALIHDI